MSEGLWPKEQPLVEQEQQPGYRIMVTRHAERVPAGHLAPEGVAHALQRGAEIGAEASVVKGFSSAESSNRAYQTSELMSEASGTVSEQTGKRYETRRAAEISYNVLKPDLTHYTKAAVARITHLVCQETGLPEGTVLEELEPKEQERLAPIRQRHQEIVLGELIREPELVHRLAICLAHRIVRELRLVSDYAKQHGDPETGRVKPKEVVINTVTHGMFSESLLLEAGFQKVDEELRPIEQWAENGFGRIMQPGEDYYFDIKNPLDRPEYYPVVFEGVDRPANGTVVISRQRLLELNQDYQQWAQTQKK